MNNYAQYIKERENKEIIENESGFLTYKIFEKECYLADMFIVPEKRGSSAVAYFIQELSDISIRAGCDHISANIRLNDKGATRTLRASLKLGFNLVSAENGTITICKELRLNGWFDRSGIKY